MNREKFRNVEKRKREYMITLFNQFSFSKTFYIDQDKLAAVCEDELVNFDEFVSFKQKEAREVAFELRTKTGCSIESCLIALDKVNGDLEKAVDYMRFGKF
jgi:hypothetical protein